MITIFGRITSSNVQLVMWATAELGLEAERVDVGGKFGGTDTPQYIAINPNRTVPAFRDGDHTMYESGAILRYLGAEYGDEAFWPSDNKKRSKLDIYAEWTKATLSPVLTYNVFWTLIRTPGSERDWDNFALQVKKLGELMLVMEKELEGSTFLGSNALSFADIMFGHLLYRYFTLDFERLNLPNLQAYYERLVEREAYRENVMIDYSVLQVQ